MRLVQLTPGAGAMYCGNCLRDNALVHALRQQGHEVTMVPLYLPLTLDEPDESAGMPIFFGGVNVYLEQHSAAYRRAPHWLRRWLTHPRLLKWAGKKTSKVDPSQLGELTLSMFRGVNGHQARDLQELTAWLEGQTHPDVVCLSNALLLGMAPTLRARLRTKLVCQFQGEDAFLDHLPEPHRTQCWDLAAQLASSVDLFIAPSRFYGELMGKRLRLPSDRIRVVQNGISIEGYGPPGQSPQPTIGFLARMCPEKGLDTLVDAFIQLHQRGVADNAHLCVTGYCGPTEAPFVGSLQKRLREAHLLAKAQFHFNPTRAEKIALLQTFTCCAVPVRTQEAFGLYALESLAAGVPVVAPRIGGLPEVIQDSGGGIIYEPDGPEALPQALEALLHDAARARTLGAAGQTAVKDRYTAQAMAARTLRVYAEVINKRAEATCAIP